LTSPGRYRALTALTLLGPATPLLFQGQEFGSSVPFLFFADHREELRQAIREGRREFLSQFVSFGDPSLDSALPSPVDEATFQKCKLDRDKRVTHAYALHRDLLRLRSTHGLIMDGSRIDGAVLGASAIVLRYFSPSEHLILIVNLGVDLDLSPAPEPLLAPPGPDGWTLIWSSESIAYGGRGTAPLWPESRWRIPGEAALLLGGRSSDDHDDD
jgi:maltooligosyltrehalose trehalohydrolase